MFFQIHRCKLAISEARWSDAVEIAWLLGEARGNLFIFYAQRRGTRKGASKTATGKREKIEQIMAMAKDFYHKEVATNKGERVKVDYLWSKVMTRMKEINGPICARSTFAGHWSGLQGQLNP